MLYRSSLIIALFVSVSFVARSQSSNLQSKIDSLQNWIYVDTVSNIEKIKLCHRIVDAGVEEGDNEALCWAYMNLGVAYYKLNAHRVSREYIAKAQSKVEKLKDNLYRARLGLLMGNYYLETKNPKLALESYESGLMYAKKLKVKNLELLLRCGMTNMNLIMGNANEALKRFEKVAPLLSGTDHKYYEALYYATYANLCSGTGENLEKGIEYANKSISICDDIHQKSILASCLIILGEIYTQLGETELAIENYEKAENLSLRYNWLSNALVALRARADLYLSIGNEAKAFETMQLALKKQDSATSILTELKFQELEDLFVAQRNEQQLNLKESEVKLLESENNRAALRTLILVVLLAFAIILIIVRVVYVRKRTERTKQLNEVKERLLQSEIEKKKIKEEQLKQTLELKEANLKSFGIDISRKHELIVEVLERLKSIQSSNQEPSTQIDIQSLINDLVSQLHIDQSMDEFTDLVESVNSSFYRSLSEQFPNLTKQDLQICSLIRLNLSNKEIAVIRNVEVDSAKTSRYRLRKKLHLGPDVDLNEFLQSF